MVIVIGSINLDLIATVDRLPAPGETVPGDRFASTSGGKGANQALAARRAGASVRMVGATGRDPFAPQALDLLQAGSVDLSRVRQTDRPTGVALILVGPGGENMIAVASGANLLVDRDAVAGAGLAAGDHLLLQHEVPLETVEAALDAARQAGAVSLLNTAPFRAEAAPLLAGANYVIANETEFDLYAGTLGLAGASRQERMLSFAGKTGRTLIVTLGGDGVLTAQAGKIIETPALRIAPVDTVGAGDTFCGYLAAGLEAGLPLTEALRRAAAGASLACLKPGAQPSIPTAADVDAALTGQA
ncbi:MAG: ribokinase [Rhizobiaceae bacterium]